MPASFVGLYIHIPFCERICPYCDFAVVAARSLEPAVEERYVAALLKELEVRAPDFAGHQLATVYFGGGTPSLLQPESLSRLLAAARAAFPTSGSEKQWLDNKTETEIEIETEIEVTLETNPSTVERGRLPAFRSLGINRLSLGIQSFDDTTLKKLGRAHKSSEALATLEAARSAGFENLSLDLILACPGQSIAAFERDLDTALSHAPEHLSVYELTIEGGTPFALANERGQLARPGDDLAAQMLELLAERCVAAGLARYEISNYARPGFESAHNSRYWARAPVLGVGMGAWSSEPKSPDLPHGGRRMNPRNLERYLAGLEGAGLEGLEGLAAADRPGIQIDRLSEPEARGEAMFLGLRRTRGLDAASFETEFGSPPRKFYSQPIDRLMAGGLIAETSSGDLRLTERGMLLSDTVYANFV